MVCILWFGGHKVVGLQETVPSLHGVEPLPDDLCGAAPAGARTPTVKTAMPTTRATVRIMTLPPRQVPLHRVAGQVRRAFPAWWQINPNPARGSSDQGFQAHRSDRAVHLELVT